LKSIELPPIYILDKPMVAIIILLSLFCEVVFKL
jgi:hypothetical protein